MGPWTWVFTALMVLWVLMSKERRKLVFVMAAYVVMCGWYQYRQVVKRMRGDAKDKDDGPVAAENASYRTPTRKTRGESSAALSAATGETPEERTARLRATIRSMNTPTQ
mmetsp:Transcript_10875/g.33080  ORF Transcript_10875/g.33080 Transcript_10875/m.33080 type:complete len:110 (-) Transcript_10875:186-515(-)